MKKGQMQHKTLLQLQRFQEYELQKKKYLEKEQESKYKSQEYQNSKQWIGDIHERQTLLQQAKWKWIQEQKKLLDERREIKLLEGATFHPQILNKDNTIRTPEQYYKDNLDYKIKTEKSIERIKKQKEDKIYNRSYSPIINKKSEQMINKQFYDRLKDKQQEKEQNLLKIKQSITPSFSPQIYSRNFQSRQAYQAVQQFVSVNSTKNKQKLDVENIINDQKTFTFFEDIRRENQISPQKQEEDKQKKSIIFLLSENNQIINVPSSPQATTKKSQRSVSPLKSIISRTTQKNYFKK